MKVKDLFEMPISDISRFDTEDPIKSQNSFRNDAKFVNHPKMDDKLKRMFQKAPVDIDIVFFNTRGIENRDIGSLDVGILADPSLLSRLKKVGIYPNPRAIKIVLTNNESDLATNLPLTPWMVGHRMSHAIIDATEIEGNLTNLVNAWFRTAREELSWSINLEDFYSSLGTFGSARTNKVGGDGEFITECMTQYLVKGRLVFNVIAPFTADETLAMEKELEIEILGLLKYAVGKVFLY